MSQLNYLEKLLDGVEVEWKFLGDVGEVTKLAGYEFTKHVKYSERGSTIALRGLNVKNGSLDLKSVKYIDDSEFSKLSRSKLYINDMLFTYVGTIGEVALVDEDDKYYLAPNVARIRFTDSSINPLFMRYYFQTNDFEKSQIGRYLSSSSMKNLTMANIRKFQVPIPCPDNPEKSLAIQAEIVRILDAFTAMTAELTAELNMRKKQYNYYRDQLLSFKEGEVEWKMLGEVALIGTGSHDTQDAIANGKYIFYARGREPLKLNEYDFDETAIITAGDGAGVGKVFHYAQGKYALHQRAYRIVPSQIMEPRFVYHYLASCFYEYIQKASVSSSVTSLRRPMFLNLPIPVPSLKKQARIVAILDKFDTLTTSIQEGLPREIELRQKQYEYYRDLLLSFPKSHSHEEA